MRFNSLKFKISVLALLILAGILIIYSGVLYYTFGSTLYQELDEGLRTKSQNVSSAITSYMNVLGHDEKSFQFSVRRVVSQAGVHPHENKIEKLDNLWLGQLAAVGENKDYIDFMNSKGLSLARSQNFPKDFPSPALKDIHETLSGKVVYRNMDVGKEHLRMILALAGTPKHPESVVMVATSRQRVDEILRDRLIVKFISIVLILILTSWLSQWFAKRILSPVNSITHAARNINYKDLSVRIKTEDTDIEMKDLVETLNEMMSRLETSFKYIAEFSAHVAHELITPLAIMRGESEWVLREDQTAEVYKKTLNDNLAEIERMTKIIDDLLLLAKLDYQPEILKFRSVDLNEFIREAKESFEILALEKHLRISVANSTVPLVIQADRVHLRRLFFNLISNAVKFSPPESEITIALKRQNQRALVSVTDRGIGIPEENLQKIFKKFYRSDVTGQSNSKSNGLGLSIAQSIVKIHSGNIEVRSTVGKGSTFTVSLPVS